LAGSGRAAALPDRFSRHSFRATTAPNLLAQSIDLGEVQGLLGHAGPHNTRLYDRWQQQVTRNLVEGISI
jgi:site-specific recombinase XerD